ncbi:sensor histidine kinase [Paenibacillus turpanensis]|uniref:sensor histidine kinase n=1 Tax=Paenibacillus turpanensis TaxID=2689078 RepID=UPI00140DCC4D|nr:sensor histidine kinase [Paenibacillus turpanensis]
MQTMRNDLEKSVKQLVDLKLALDESSIVAVTDHRGVIQYVNDKFCEISKYSREELIGKDHRLINSGYHSKDFMRQLWGTISQGKVWKGEVKNRAKDGTFYWVNTTIVPIQQEDGSPYQYLAIRNEVTKLKHVEEELQLMMTQMLRVQEEERKRISRELHDGIGQTLFSLLIQVDKIKTEVEHEGLGLLRKDITHLIEDIRSISWELRPSVLDDLGVVPAIRTYIQNFERHYGISVGLDCNLGKRLEVHTETTIYRIIQEALTNIAKYADVSEAKVSISESVGAVNVQIEDRGVGFRPDTAAKGVGLFSMEERARSVGGSLRVQSEVGHGTTVTLSIPNLQ